MAFNFQKTDDRCHWPKHVYRSLRFHENKLPCLACNSRIVHLQSHSRGQILQKTHLSWNFTAAKINKKDRGRGWAHPLAWKGTGFRVSIADSLLDGFLQDSDVPFQGVCRPRVQQLVEELKAGPAQNTISMRMLKMHKHRVVVSQACWNIICN